MSFLLGHIVRTQIENLQTQINRLYALGLNERSDVVNDAPPKFFSKNGNFYKLQKKVQAESRFCLSRLFYTAEQSKLKLEQRAFLRKIDFVLNHLDWLRDSINPSLRQSMRAYRTQPNTELR